ncbi:MAG TPA: crosslink repair DNA glycosylase YcaQ family protein [Mobilitalea sp.]|nr:crosslink repair DNA glycosylase YcaQ family protein [Mobilitalea sp.]
MYNLTKEQAKRFILKKQGLSGDYRFSGKEGILNFIRQAGCIQYDPIDVCGKNAELVLQSRIKGFTKKMLYELLYEDRKLIDYFDKCLAIMNAEDWNYFERIRESNRNQSRGRDEVDEIADTIINIISEKGPVCSKDLDFNEKVDWYWNNTKLSRAALETLYFRGDLIIHHKKGTIKYYALAKDFLPQDLLAAKDPLPDALEHLKWRVLRRISALGLLWNKPSDAWIGIRNFKAAERNEVFASLITENKISEVNIDGCKDKLYCLTEDSILIEEVINEYGTEDEGRNRTELIAALDCMIWDRKLIKTIFDFDYKWEIYTPISMRKYGYYVLPILSGDKFIGRAEIISDRKSSTLVVKNIWCEEGVRVTAKLKNMLKQCFLRFQKFHGLKEINFSDDCFKSDLR